MSQDSRINMMYFYDALCGWCYGFSPVMQEFAMKHQEEIKLEVFSGGMISGSRIGPIGQVAGYIKQAYKTVEDRTGVMFGEGFLEGILEPGDAIFTSIPAAKAMLIFKKLLPARQLEYAGRLQQAVYFDGIQPDDKEAYVKAAAEFGVDEEEFSRLYDEPETAQGMLKEFEFVGELGINGFPSIVAEAKGKLYLLAHGYLPLEELEKNFESLKAKASEA
ncbi:MAG: DsbA family protein [Bacteroidota bacterium]